VAGLDIAYQDGGLWLAREGLWLDPHRTQGGAEPVFVSHAHSDHIRPHRRVLLSLPTSRLMQMRLGGEREERILDFGARTVIEGRHGACALTLLPAGHILGSAMAFVETDRGSLLYTGDFKLRGGLTAEPCDPAPARDCDVLIMETTYGRPHYRLPAEDEVWRDIVQFCRETVEAGGTAVLLAYSMGKSQEVLCGLAGAGLPIMVHDSVWRIAQVYQRCGIVFPPFRRLGRGVPEGGVVLYPPQAVKPEGFRSFRKPRVAVISGWAIDASCRYQHGADAAFPLSDHADFGQLQEMVRLIRPKKVLTLHGFAADFAREARRLGVEAQALSEDEQLHLPL